MLAMFKIFEQYPDALRTGFTRLRDRLTDDDPGERAFGPSRGGEVRSY